uniref:Aminotransferase-like protein n=1 Tax=Oryza sativa subsp. japonica TaxID=39947 RepID=Q2RB68_ORYSJ|nr:hypothetical protein LOC_Os11g03020 [Oryza sativa Japonica Group]
MVWLFASATVAELNRAAMTEPAKSPKAMAVKRFGRALTYPCKRNRRGHGTGNYTGHGRWTERKELVSRLEEEEKKRLIILSGICGGGSPGPIQSNIDQLESRRIELLAQLEECNAELALEKQKLADLPKVVEEQKSKLKASIKHLAEMTKSLKVIPETDAQDAQAIEEVMQIRQRAISAIQRYIAE